MNYNKTKFRSGVTLLELLIALTIMAMLMAAVATAMHGALHNYAENEELSTATQIARTTIGRITREVRTAAAVDCTTTSITIIPSDTTGGLQQTQYEFSEGVLCYRRTISGTTTSYILLGGEGDEASVETFSVIQELGQDWQGETCTKSVTIRLVIAVDNQSIAVTASSAPRRNQLY